MEKCHKMQEKKNKVQRPERIMSDHLVAKNWGEQVTVPPIHSVG